MAVAGSDRRTEISNWLGQRAGLPWCVLGAGLGAVLAGVGLAAPGLSGLGWAGVVLALGGAGFGLNTALQTGGRSRRGVQALADALSSSEIGWYVADARGDTVYVNVAYRHLLDIDDSVEAPAPRTLLEGLADAKTGQAVIDLPLRNGLVRRLGFRQESGLSGSGQALQLWRVEEIAEAAPGAVDRRLADFLVATLDAAPIGLFATDGDGRFTFANEQAAHMLGVPRQTLIAGGVGLGEFVVESERPSMNGAGSQADDPVVEGTIKIRQADGSTRNAVVSLCSVGEGSDAPVIGLLRELGASAEQQQVAAIERLKALFENAPIGIAALDNEGVVIECNAAVARFLAGEGGDPRGQRFADLLDEPDRNEVSAALAAILVREKRRMPLEVRPRARRNAVASLYASRIEEPDGSVRGLILHMIDTTEQKNLELQFAQAQKMQAIGQLAGGIAHDFNNLLTAIIGFCDLLLMRHQAGDHSFADIMQIKQNASRAANLVRQLLAFSRQQTLKPTVLSVTDVLAELSNLIRRLIGESIELKVVHGRDVAVIRADQGQLEQVLVNMAVNARDAMPEGGTLSIRTRNVSRTESAQLGHELLPAGEYVLIEVIDTGVGIPKEHLGKIFEPFFTTKGVGAGTGLGLSTVYGIVKQFGGYVFCESEVGRGTGFSVFLPQYHGSEVAAAAPTERNTDSLDLTGRGTILLVEDEAPVRMFGARALRNKGYTVLEADSGEAALDVINSARQSIDLLITDVVMPKMDGPTLTKQVRHRLPNLKVIYISGYAEDAFRNSVGADINFLPKPFSLRQLASKVKEVMTGDAA